MKESTFIGWASLLILVAGVTGYVMNIIALINTTPFEWSALVVLRIIGVMSPIGCIMGYV